MARTAPQRNYRRNPHTANFLMTFHAGNGQSLPAEILKDGTKLDSDGNPWIDPADREEGAALAFLASDATRDEYVAPGADYAGQPSYSKAARPVAGYLVEFAGHEVRCGDGFITEAQANWIVDILVKREVAGAEQTFIRLEQGLAKHAGSQFISANKNAPLKPQPVAAAPAEVAEGIIPNGRYGIRHDGEIKCYKVGNGREGTSWEGFVFLDRISSDNEFKIRNGAEKARILQAILDMGIEASQILAAVTISQCRRCGRALSDTKNPYKEIGLGPECGTK